MERFVKLGLIIVVSAIIVSTGFKASDQTFRKSAAAPAGHTGSPGDGKSCVKCHKGASVEEKDGIVSSDIPSEGYEPGKEYTITATFEKSGHEEFGFQISPQNSKGDILGTLASTSSQTKLVGTNKGYITHTSSGISAEAGKKNWSFNWTAPREGSGDVTFYGAFNATNNNNKSSGDLIFLSNLKVKENITIGINNVSQNDLSFVAYPNPVADVINIKYNLIETAKVDFSIFNIEGKMVDNLSSETETAGIYHKSFNLNNGKYPGGLYFVHLKLGDKLTVRKILKR